MQYLGAISKTTELILVHFQGKPFNITVIQAYIPTINVKEAEQFNEDLQNLLELTPKKGHPFNHRGLEWKSSKWRDTWSNGKVWPWSTKWSRAKANRVLPRECTGHRKYLLPTTQEMILHMDVTRWSILKSDWLFSLQLKMDSSIQSAKTRLGADCGPDHEVLIAKFSLKLKKVGKTTRPFSMT